MSVLIEPAKPTGLEILMGRLATISGTIRAADGKATSNDEVILARPGEKPVHGESSSSTAGGEWERDWADGGSVWCRSRKFTLGLPAGRWTVWWADAEGKNRAIAEWTIEDGETRTIDIDLPAK